MTTTASVTFPFTTLVLRWLGRAMLALLFLILLDTAPARAEGPALALVDDAGKATLSLRQASDLSLEIHGLVAVAVLEQSFENTAPGWRHGVYSFPLPGQAAVRRLDFVVGERVIRGRVREREEAAKVFEAAKREGKQAALVEQQRPNLFTSRLANIPPGETVRVRLELVLPVAYEDGVFSLRFPSTVTPRYIPGQPLVGEPDTAGDNWSRPTDQVPDAHRITPLQHAAAGSDAAPLNPMQVALSLDAGVPLASVEALYHDLALERDGARYRASLRAGVAEMDRDFVLRWVPVRGTAPAAALYSEVVDGQHYAYLMLLPPRPGGQAPPPRELVLVVDRSGSMGGTPIEQARASVHAALAALRPEDHFNVIAFDDKVEALYPSAQAATPAALQAARRYVDRLDARGGTEMRPALELALPAAEQGAGRLRQVVFITDGAVGNERALFARIRERLGRARLFTVGIGSAPNSWFMRRASEVGRGTFTHIGKAEEAGPAMDALLARLASPVLTGIDVRWPAGADAVPAIVPDLYTGQPVLQAVALPGALDGSVKITGQRAGELWSQTLVVNERSGDAPGVGTLWARGRVQALLDTLEVGAERQAVRAQVLPLALTHQLLTPFTSFIAVEERRARPAKVDARDSVAPNARPAGQAPQPFAFPATATTARAKIWAGLLLLFMATVLFALREEGRTP
ncbi:marine proteobacterial sortase target protein [Pseudohaliea rubra]|uniref:Inter-alpha-trypsin inhibitor domain protein n=1 Tax=Pseudohaliea rubra DSM 19751 TaxID=1265313 RepID=A0A095VT49_9GAMM|nr:marine proteobacterial sortase target protein [Pseudohaliea rubra]KGE04602.1 Inter-alpha-trypsin inhibitor domain protein [Pseudohaliea rubra DSM 19751]